eukprot:4681062-Prymnesium_polylepis.1
MLQVSSLDMRPQFPRGRFACTCPQREQATWENGSGRAGGEVWRTAEIHLPHVLESESVGVTSSAASGGDLGVVGGG